LLDLWRGYIQATRDAYTFIASVFYRGWDWLLGSKTTLRVLERTHARLQQRHEKTNKELKVLRSTLEEITRVATKVDALEKEHEEMGKELQAVAALSKDATTLVSRVTEAKDSTDKEPQPATHDTVATLAALVESVKKASSDQDNLFNKVHGIEEDARKHTRQLADVGLEVSKIRWASFDYNKALTELRRQVADVKAHQDLTAEQYAHLDAVEQKLVDLLEKGTLKRFNSSGSTSSRSSDLDLPLGVVIGIGLLETGIWLHLWITTVAENRVSELRTELDDVRSKLRDNIRDVNSKIWKESHELRSDLADNVRSVRSELAKIGRQVHEHYLEFIPIQHRVRSVRLSPGDDTETEVRLAGLQREVQAVKWAQVEVPALKQQLAEVPALKHQVVALQARLDKLEKQKMERRRKKEEMANRRLV
ncbi:putative microtubule-associated protein, partial [Rhodotorula toruloides]